MTQDDLAKLYEKANGWSPATFQITMEELERFAALVAAHEREACAKVCEALGNDASIDDLAYEAFREADEAIRARGEGKQ